MSTMYFPWCIEVPQVTVLTVRIPMTAENLRIYPDSLCCLPLECGPKQNLPSAVGEDGSSNQLNEESLSFSVALNRNINNRDETNMFF